MTNDELHELSAAYALDALDANERREFEQHLSECERCRAEVAALGETVGVLPYAVEGGEPPRTLRDRILVAAREEQPKVVALRSSRRRLYMGAAVAAAACAALAIGLTLGLSGGGGTKIALTVHPGGVAQLAVSGFDPAPPGKIYEVWVIGLDGKPLPAAVFPGGTHAVVALERPVPPGATVAVTLERAPRATAPTLPILVKTTAPV